MVVGRFNQTASSFLNTVKYGVSALALSALLVSVPLAWSETSSVMYPAAITNAEPRIIGIAPDSPQVKSLIELFNGLSNASNRHNIDDLLKHFSPSFISGDNFTLPQLKQQILDTWKAYDQIKYTSQILEIRVQGDWATLETLDQAEAVAPPDKSFMDQTPGKMFSQSRNQLFLKRSGSMWEIKSDQTLWEQAVIRYGIGEDVDITLSVPEQVKTGDTYSANVMATIPEGTFLIGTITNEPITFPHTKPDDSFRTMDSDNYELQRVLKANSENRNEIVSATLGMTNISQKMSGERPSLSVNGLITIVKRVNVVPSTSDDLIKAMQKQTSVNAASAQCTPASKDGAEQAK